MYQKNINNFKKNQMLHINLLKFFQMTFNCFSRFQMILNDIKYLKKFSDDI